MVILLVAICCTQVDSIGRGHARPKAKKCEKIEVPMCQEIGYNLTYMPNKFGHNTQTRRSSDLAASQALRVFALRAHVRSHILQGDSAVSFVLRGRSRFLRQRHEEEWVPVARQLEVRTVPNAQGKRHLYETK